jgi:hypothetical protein
MESNMEIKKITKTLIAINQPEILFIIKNY